MASTTAPGPVTALRLQQITYETLTTVHLFDHASTRGAQSLLGSVLFEPAMVASGAVSVHAIEHLPGSVLRLSVIVFPPSGQSRRLSSSKPALIALDVLPGVPCAEVVRARGRGPRGHYD